MFTSLRHIWKTGEISLKTKISIFKSIDSSTLFYGAEFWKMNKMIGQTLEVFQNRCLTIFWPNIISSEELYTQTSILVSEIKRRRWSFHQNTCEPHQEWHSRWTPPGKRKREDPKKHGGQWKKKSERAV